MELEEQAGAGAVAVEEGEAEVDREVKGTHGLVLALNYLIICMLHLLDRRFWAPLSLLLTLLHSPLLSSQNL